MGSHFGQDGGPVGQDRRVFWLEQPGRANQATGNQAKLALPVEPPLDVPVENHMRQKLVTFTDCNIRNFVTTGSVRCR